MAETKEEPKQSLPAGHPAAGYTAPDLSYHEGTGSIPDEEKEWHEKRNSVREEEVEAVADAEDKVAKEEAKAREEASAEAAKEAETTASTAPSSTAKTASTKS